MTVDSLTYEWLIMGLIFCAVYAFVFLAIRGRVDSYYMIIRMNRYRRSGLRLAIMPILMRITRLRRTFMSDNSAYIKNLNEKLNRAHMKNIADASELVALQIFYALAGITLLLLLLAFIPKQDANHNAAILVLGTVTIFALSSHPVSSINTLLDRKKTEMIKEWPFFMDLLTLAMEGGMDMISATRQIIYSSGYITPLFEELREMLNEIELGKTHNDAIQSLANRIDSEAISSVINLMLQAEQLGMPIAPLLHAQSKDFRERRVQHVEKLAQEAPVKMMGPLLGCIFPAILLILLGPLLLQYMGSQ